MTDAVRDQNHVTVALGVSSTSATTTLPFKIDPITGRLLVDSAGGSSSPGGNDTDIQFNDSGSFGGEDTFSFDKTTVEVTLGQIGSNASLLTLHAGIIDNTSIQSNGALDIFVKDGPSAARNLSISTGLDTQAADGNGGSISISTATGGGTGAGGDISLLAGDSGPTGADGTAGNVTITAGNGAASNGGIVQIVTGDAVSGNKTGGAFSVNAGSGFGSGTGGSVGLSAGGGGATGSGGSVSLLAGNGGGTSGSGGVIQIIAGSGINGNANGGSIALIPGVKDGAGSNGTVFIQDPSSAKDAIFDTSLLLANRTYTFPDASGTIALTGGTVTASLITVANEATDTSCFPVFVTAATGDLGPKSNAGLTFNSNTSLLTATLLAGTTSVTSATVRASSNDSGSLGASGTAFSDLFLASGALIDFAAGNSVITHSSAVLTVSTGDLRVTTAGTNSASVVTVGGAQTLTSKVLTAATITTSLVPTSNDGAPLGDTTHQFSDLFLAEGGVINFDNGDLTLTQTNNELVLAGGNLDINGNILRLGDGGTTRLIVPTVDGTATGPTTAAFVSGYSSSAVGDLVYLDSNGKWQKTDSDALSTTTGLLAIALAVAATDAALLVALPGSIVYATAFPTLTIGAPYYVGETAGAIQSAIPTGADNAVRVVGFGVHADKLFFLPSSDTSTTVA